MTCNRCGFSNAPEARFCNVCGDRLGEEAAVHTTTSVPVVAPAPAPQYQPAPPTQPVALPNHLPTTWRAPSNGALVSIILLIGAAFLPWLSTPGIAAMGVEIPAAFLFDRGAPADPFTLGIVLFVLAGLILIGTLIRPLDSLRPFAGGLAVLMAVMMVVQWRNFLSGMDLSDLALGFVGVGVYAALAGGLTAMLARGR